MIFHGGTPTIPFGPLAQVPLVYTGAPMVQPNYPMVSPQSAGAPMGCGNCTRGMSGLGVVSSLSTGGKVVLGVLGLGLVFGAVMAYRNVKT